MREELPISLGPMKTANVTVIDRSNGVEQVKISADRFVGDVSGAYHPSLDLGINEENIPVFLDFKNEIGNIYLTASSLHDSLLTELAPAVFHASPGHKAATNLYIKNFGLHLNDFIIIEARDSRGN